MKNIFISVLLTLALCPSQMKAQQNPILPGFHADPEITYSNQTHRYYIYSTTDGTPGWAVTLTSASRLPTSKSGVTRARCSMPRTVR